jgi:hypothetical protein
LDCDRTFIVARRLDVPRWQAHLRTALQCRELLRLVDKCDLDQHQRKRAKLAVARMFMRRQRSRVARRSRILLRIPLELASPPPTRSPPPRTARQTTADAGQLNLRIGE